MSSQELRKPDGVLSQEIQAVPVKCSEVAPLNYEAALSSYSKEEQQEIMALAESIDVKEADKVMNYGAEPLKQTFTQCGDFLKSERGSKADQEVLDMVITLAKKAKDSYEDFNLIIKEPSFLQKIFFKLATSEKESHMDKIQRGAVSSYNLLMELQSSSKKWLETLKQSMGVISASIESDTEGIDLLEKYIVAGKIATRRIEQKLDEIQAQYNETGLQKYATQYDEYKEGYDLFVISMNNLEKSRVAYYLSIGQLSLAKRANRNVQISVNTQANESMAFMAQQLRNATLNAKTREVLEGQKAISRLNNELMKEVSRTVGLTAEESEKLIYAGFYDVDSAKQAFQTVINSCTAIQKTAEEMLPKMKADLDELNGLLNELEPYVQSVEMPMANLNATSEVSSTQTFNASSTNDALKLKF